MRSLVPRMTNLSLRLGVILLVMVLVVLFGGIWAMIQVAADRLMNAHALATARDWAQFVGANVADLEQIAAGEQPSAASMRFLQTARKSEAVYRYIIFNRDGYSQLVSSRDRIVLVDLSERSAEAGRAATTGQVVVAMNTTSSPDRPGYFAEAFIPAVVRGETVAVVGAYVDETDVRNHLQYGVLASVPVLCALVGFAFGVPTIAWYRRTKEKQHADRRIRYLAHHDELTGLANRAHLIERLDDALALLPSTGAQLALHFIDLDRFKQVNDWFGHDGGDFLLRTVAQRLREVVRAEDTIARLGGDEFVVVQTELRSKQQAEAFAERLMSALIPPIWYKQQEITVGFTIGIARTPSDGVTRDQLLKSADLALYNGKTEGRNCIRFFSPEMDEAFKQRLELESVIRDASANERFVLYYQPVFEIRDGRLVGFEALLRLPRPDGSMMPPATFIPMIEEMRLIDKVGIWALREACRAAMTWPRSLTVAVNLSSSQFEMKSISHMVETVLTETGLEPHRLELEITESLLLRNNDHTTEELGKLKEMGVAIVMDDFGTGYSSLSYLWQFPFDKIKIDRSFMQGYEDSAGDVETVVRAIIALGRELHKRVTVEGVETAKQVDFLYDANADQVQGFFFGRPAPATDVASIIQEHLAV
ncbi:EAL domain-containing protein [Bradyrhizobium hipponense]|uniref:EAL domain-containing protein n=2 Tax=Bradyrhizobium hipponense TaxID=2605638 RepID=A0A5S4YE24_9BRAD|nr:EAL domain-containing protein [Bradyrhizobium hipponense]